MEANLIWTLVGFFLTLLVFSYVFGDNPLFRVATYTLVGIAAGYLSVMVFYYVLVPRLLVPLLNGSPEEKLLALVPLVLGLLMVAKLFPRVSGLGNVSMAYLVGVGVAVMIGGAVLGTIISQVNASINLFDMNAATVNGIGPLTSLGGGIIVVLGTISTLVYFQFGGVKKDSPSGKRSLLVEIIAWAGKIFIAISLGAVFAGVYMAALTALADRLDFLIRAFSNLF